MSREDYREWLRVGPDRLGLAKTERALRWHDGDPQEAARLAARHKDG